VRRERADVEEATEICEINARGRAIPEKHRERDHETEEQWRAQREGGRERGTVGDAEAEPERGDDRTRCSLRH